MYLKYDTKPSPANIRRRLTQLEEILSNTDDMLKRWRPARRHHKKYRLAMKQRIRRMATPLAELRLLLDGRWAP